MRRRGLDSADSFDQVVQRVNHHKPATRVSQPRSLGGLLHREMEIRGIVETQQGTGTFVATRRADRRPAERRRALEGLVDRFVARAMSTTFPRLKGMGAGEMGYSTSEVGDMVAASVSGSGG